MSKHYVAYHNVDRMNRPLTDGDPCRVISKAPLRRLQGQTVWMVVGKTTKGVKRKQFSLGSVFAVNDVGALDEGEFQYYARGAGHVFDLPPVLNDEPWFDGFRLRSRSFEGIQPLADEAHLAALKEVAARHGCVIE